MSGHPGHNTPYTAHRIAMGSFMGMDDLITKRSNASQATLGIYG